MLTALRSRSGALQAFTEQRPDQLERDLARALAEAGYMPLSAYVDDQPLAADRIPQQQRPRVPAWLGLLVGCIVCAGPLYILGVIWLGAGR
jgi:hypothetical protein